MRVALLQQARTFVSDDRLNGSQALICIPIGVIRGDHVTEGSEQVVGPLLMREVMPRQYFFATAMDPYHPLDEHLA
jgi:hypothetical protein